MNGHEKEVRELIGKFFGEQKGKVNIWMESRNPLLGMLTPLQMIQYGRGERLLEFVRNSLEENERAQK